MMTDSVALVEHVVIALQAYGANYRRGEWWARCPFHDEGTASFAFHPEKATWFCQGCHAGGGVLDLARRLGISRAELAPDTLNQMRELREANAERIAELRQEKAQALRAWWKAHAEETRLIGQNRMIAELLSSGVRESAVEYFQFGVTQYPVFDAELGGWRRIEALTIPWTVRGEIRALQYRLSEDVNGRYRWHTGSVAKLYNADAILEPKDNHVVVVEGAKKAASLWGFGFESVVAIANKGAWKELASEEFRKPFARFGRVVFALDPDAIEEAREAAATLPNGWVATLPRKPDDMMVETGGNPEVMNGFLMRARRP